MEDLLNESAFLDGGERDYFLTDPLEEEVSFSAFATDFLLEEAIAAGFIAAEEGVLGVYGAPSRGSKLEEVVLADDFGVQFSGLGSLALPRVLPYDQASGRPPAPLPPCGPGTLGHPTTRSKVPPYNRVLLLEPLYSLDYVVHWTY